MPKSLSLALLIAAPFFASLTALAAQTRKTYEVGSLLTPMGALVHADDGRRSLAS